MFELLFYVQSREISKKLLELLTNRVGIQYSTKSEDVHAKQFNHNPLRNYEFLLTSYIVLPYASSCNPSLFLKNQEHSKTVNDANKNNSEALPF